MTEGVNGVADAKKTRKMLVGIIVALVAVMIAVAAIFVIKNHKEKIRLETYVIYETNGFNSAGTMSVYIDSEELEDAVKPIIERKVEKRAKKYKSAIEKYYYYDKDLPSDLDEDELGILEDYLWDEEIYADDLVRVTAEPTSGLSNGDKVTVTFHYDNDILGKYGLNFEDDTMTIVVSDLPEAETVDVFKDVELTFSGASPLLYTDSYYTVEVGGQNVRITCEPYENLKIGDEVTLTVDTSQIPEGYVAKEATKTVTVENADQYIQQLANVTDDLWELLKTQAEDELAADVAENWSDDVVFNNMEYQGAYLLTPKTLDYWDYETKLYLIYKVNATTPTGSVSYYWFIKWENPMLYEDGTAGIANITSCTFPETMGWFAPDYYVEFDGYTFGGCSSIDVLYSEIITPQVGDYNVETDIR